MISIVPKWYTSFFSITWMLCTALQNALRSSITCLRARGPSTYEPSRQSPALAGSRSPVGDADAVVRLAFRALAGGRGGPSPFDSRRAGTGSVRRASVHGRRPLHHGGSVAAPGA